MSDTEENPKEEINESGEEEEEKKVTEEKKKKSKKTRYPVIHRNVYSEEYKDRLAKCFDDKKWLSLKFVSIEKRNQYVQGNAAIYTPNELLDGEKKAWDEKWGIESVQYFRTTNELIDHLKSEHGIEIQSSHLYRSHLLAANHTMDFNKMKD